MTRGNLFRVIADRIRAQRRAREDAQSFAWARERDASCAWLCAGEPLRRAICNLAGIENAGGKLYIGELTVRERVAIVVALREPEVRKVVPDSIRWGLEQLAEVPREYRLGDAA